MSIYEFHVVGGMPFMSTLSLIFVINLGLILFLIIRQIQKKIIHSNWLEMIKHLAGLAVAFGTFSTIIGLFFAFGAIEASPEVIPLQVIAGGLKVGVITVLYGLIIYCISLLAYIILKLANKSSAV